MRLAEWIKELERDEQGYVRRCFRFWGNDGSNHPNIPQGMSKARADILRYHTQALMDTTTRRRKVDELKPICFRAPEEFKKQLAFDAAELDVNLSIFIRACIEAGRPFVKANPKIINFFDSVIPK